MKRAIFFIDGFNLYHSIKNIIKLPVNPALQPTSRNYKWLNLKELCRLLCERNETLEEVCYFTSLCAWDKDKANKHKLFISAVEDTGVNIIYGKFKLVTKNCQLCRKAFQTYEEKRTDVSLGIKLLSFACQDKYDVAYLLSGDSDLIPAIEEVKLLYPQKEIISVIPFGRKGEELKAACHSQKKIKEIHLISSMFNFELNLQDGTHISCPVKWR